MRQTFTIALTCLLSLFFFQDIAAQTDKTVGISFQNPMKSQDEIKLTLSAMQEVEMRLLDANGNFVKLLMMQELMAGDHAVPVILSDVQAGTYQLQITSGEQTAIKEVVVAPRFKTASEYTEIIADPIEKTLDFEVPAVLRNGRDFKLKVEEITDVEIRLENQGGEFVKLILKQELMPGIHSIPISIGDVKNGMYLLKIDLGDRVETKKVAVEHY